MGNASSGRKDVHKSDSTLEFETGKKLLLPSEQDTKRQPISKKFLFAYSN